MPRTRSIAWSELKLGIVGIVALGLTAMLIVAVGGQGGFFWQRYGLKTRFQAVQGLKTGAVVRLNGMDEGKVTNVVFVGAQIEVWMQISKDVRSLITTDSVASVGALSLLGEPIIDITAAAHGQPLGDWGYVPSTETGGPFGGLTSTMSQGLTQVSRVLEDVRAGRGTIGKLVTDDALYNDLDRFVASADRVARAFESGKGTIGQLTSDPAAYKELKASLENLRTMTDRLNRGQGPLGRLLNDEAMGNSLGATMGNADEITRRLKNGEGTVGKLLTDQQLYDRFNRLTSRVDQLVADLGAGQGTAGQLLHNQQLYDNIDRAANELRGLLADIRKDPKKFLRVSISIF